MARTSSAPIASPGALPRHWEKRVLYAYLRMLGATQKDAGSAVGRAKRTVQEWEEDRVTFAQARDAARQRWLVELGDAARVTLLATIRGGHGVLALQVLERLDPALAPAKQTEQAPPDIHIHVEAARERLSVRLSHLARRHEEDASDAHPTLPGESSRLTA